MSFAGAFPAQLSGGMRSGCASPHAGHAGRACLLLDEPFGALDQQTRC
jgi:NitT/TauT family transport system ATP-binding protein